MTPFRYSVGLNGVHFQDVSRKKTYNKNDRHEEIHKQEFLSKKRRNFLVNIIALTPFTDIIKGLDSLFLLKHFKGPSKSTGHLELLGRLTVTSLAGRASPAPLLTVVSEPSTCMVRSALGYVPTPS